MEDAHDVDGFSRPHVSDSLEKVQDWAAAAATGQASEYPDLSIGIPMGVQGFAAMAEMQDQELHCRHTIEGHQAAEWSRSASPCGMCALV